MKSLYHGINNTYVYHLYDYDSNIWIYMWGFNESMILYATNYYHNGHGSITHLYIIYFFRCRTNDPE